MATKTFAYLYATDSSGMILDSTVLDEATVTAADETLTLDENATITVPSIGIDESLPYAGRFGNDVFFDAGGAELWLLSDNNYLPGETIPLNPAPYVLCFLEGTMIATPVGEVAIETLKPGDLVFTADGASKPVHWLARQTVSTIFADPLGVMPVRIAAGALGEGLPTRDLYVSPDHALEIDGVLVHAGALVNGTTITRHTDMPTSFVYYHVELEDHSLIRAEGVAAETFVDNVTRRRFDNWQEAPEAPIAEMDRPRIKSARQLPASIRGRIAAQVSAVETAA
ncbi:Hint domain-containing protein [Ancylobacter defluvii]|uniref:Hedgehog/Intein (Hint) domain-containing protein n=1 Tax=Ancylobacter defluvii TaxID=1282440 RepID=A0A9W6NBI9_9HYPH|nr:Hint domain-containing protein [Ancylobacter defluvii]MBS7589062.1 Hint domain-containing protein [Ancylobacter defluvii]GLK84672.1 hypothetical protein GCM10017653_27420 [Ancylobacter defluvii]